MGADEKTLRETKDAMLGGLAGLPGRTASLESLESIVDPILHKMEREDAAPEVSGPAVSGAVVEGDIELQRLERDGAGNARAFSREVTPEEVARERKRNPFDIRVQVQDAIRLLLTLPEWKARLTKIAMSNMNHAEKTKAYMKVMEDATRVFGDIKPVVREKKIIVGAS